jgi:hypothetical protein
MHLHICLSAVDAQSVRYDKRDTSLKQICRKCIHNCGGAITLG